MSEQTKFNKYRVRRYLETAERIWTYEGPPNPNYPHALLTTGLHSNGFVDVGTFLKNENYLQARINIANFILEALSEVWKSGFMHVVGAATSSTMLAKTIADISLTDHVKMIKTDKDQIWDPTNKPLIKGGIILQVEDLITTGESSLKVRNAIRAQYPKQDIQFVPFLPVVVDRSDPDNRITTIENSRVLPLLKLDIQTFQPDDCPYCVVGSEAIRPREGNNWNRLTRKT